MLDGVLAGRGSMFSIGEFSRITGLTVKTLRFYHEEGVLEPAVVDPRSGYRYYERRQVESARAIEYLRSMEFSLSEIKELLAHAGDDGEVLAAMQRQRETLERKIQGLRKAVRSLDQFLAEERQARAMAQDTTYNVEEKTLEPILIAGVRMKGKYCDCGKGFSKIGRNFGRYICGKSMMLHYDCEYKENDADFEACMPVKQKKDVDGISVRELPGGKCVTLIHKGPYEQLGRSYERILDYMRQKGYQVSSPSREVYIKGPGMIFKGNPKNYLTEIQMLVVPAAA